LSESRRTPRSYAPLIVAALIFFNGLIQVASGIAHVLDLEHYLQVDRGDVRYLDVTPGLAPEGLVLVVLGSVLIFLGKGLAERRRRAFKLSLWVLGLLILNSFWQGASVRATALPTLVFGLLLLVRDEFSYRPDRRRFSYAEIVAALSVLFALGFGVVGSFLLRRDFDGIDDWTDAVYFTVVTFSTLGFGDILPTTANAKIFTIFMVILGLASFATALTVIAGPFIEERIKGVVSVMSKFQKTVNHVVICGFSNAAESVIDELRERDVPFVVIEPREDVVAMLKGKGIDVLAGDPTVRQSLEAANLGHAAAVIAATDSDADNTLIAITAGRLRDAEATMDFRIVVRVENEENVEKVQSAGADEVISPSTLGGRLMATRALETMPRP
jgi:voltage-gated potassium channel